ncbi:MAG: hypothetical protein WCL42_07905 [Chlorobiaceae bacterium]|jgi:hypothetical protein
MEGKEEGIETGIEQGKLDVCRKIGSALHYTDNRHSIRADELLATLQADGFTELSVSVIQPGIE